MVSNYVTEGPCGSHVQARGDESRGDEAWGPGGMRPGGMRPGGMRLVCRSRAVCFRSTDVMPGSRRFGTIHFDGN